jgi:translation initiation factor IF-1
MEQRMKPGDKIRVTFPGHDDEVHGEAVVTAVLPENVVRAKMVDSGHPFATVELTVVPGNYEMV